MAKKLARLNVEIAFTEPKVWRQIEVATEITLPNLHEVIQAVFEWENYHLFEFQAGGKRYGVHDPEDGYQDPIIGMKKVPLQQIIDEGADRFTYTYDFGDDWIHHIEIEAVEPASQKASIRFIDGERRGPPEDIGSSPGFDRLLKALADKRHPEHRDMRQFVGPDYDPAVIDADAIRMRLSALK